MTEKLSNDRNKKVLENLKAIKSAVAEHEKANNVKIMAVTKTVPADIVNTAIDEGGIRLLGENRVQELLDKYDDYHKDGCEIHFIGHLQTNKVKYIVDKVDMIESVDSEKLADVIERECEKIGKVMPVLVEVNIGREESKSGVYPEKLEELLHYISKKAHIKVRGLMFIPPNCSDIKQKNDIFSQIQKVFIDISTKNIDNVNMDYLSAGMSNDYTIAIEHGANIIRLGRALFGDRK